MTLGGGGGGQVAAVVQANTGSVQRAASIAMMPGKFI